jgi:hypothetical protein
MMMRRLSVALLIAATLTLGACAGGIAAVQGPYTTTKTFDVTLGQRWADISGWFYQRPREVRILTVDGPILNQLVLVSDLAPGKFIIKPVKKELPTPTWRADMTETELVEFVTDSVAAMGYLRPETTELRPQAFGAAEGTRFDITAVSDTGLNMAGTALLSRTGDRLNVIIFIAPQEHYFGSLLPEVEAIMGSARMKAG